MPREPGLHLWMLMGGVVVDDSLNNPAGWHRALDSIGKADELLMADTGLAASGRDIGEADTHYKSWEVPYLPVAAVHRTIAPRRDLTQ